MGLVYEEMGQPTDVCLTEADIPEICRYMGYGGAQPDQLTYDRIRRCIEDIKKVARASFRYVVFDRQGQEYPPECSFLSGADIERHLCGCHQILLLAATSGPGVDALSRRAAIRDVADQLVYDTCGSAFIEKIMDSIEAHIRYRSAQDGLYLTWRFSPGYGDLPLSCQRDFIRVTDATRKIGLAVNASGMLTPLKSVTAIMGIARQPVGGAIADCSSCTLKRDCYLLKAGRPCWKKDS